MKVKEMDGAYLIWLNELEENLEQVNTKVQEFRKKGRTFIFYSGEEALDGLLNEIVIPILNNKKEDI